MSHHIFTAGMEAERLEASEKEREIGEVYVPSCNVLYILYLKFDGPWGSWCGFSLQIYHYHISNKYPGYLAIFGNGLLVEDFLLFLFDTSYNPFFLFNYKVLKYHVRNMILSRAYNHSTSVVFFFLILLKDSIILFRCYVTLNKKTSRVTPR